jgi:hypothetical protein
MDSASGNQASTETHNKRVRFDSSTSDSHTTTAGTPPTTSTSPTSHAEAVLLKFTATLHPELAIFFNQLGKQHLRILNKGHKKQQALTKMESDPNFIPRSARFAFEFFVSDEVKKSTAFQDIAMETDVLISQLHQSLRDQIIRVTRLECQAYNKTTVLSYAKLVRTMAGAINLAESPTNNNNTLDKLVINLFTVKQDDLLLPFRITLANFLPSYKEANGILDELPAPTVHYAEPNDSIVLQNMTITFEPTPVDPLLTKISEYIKRVLIDPYNAFVERFNENEHTLRLKSFCVDSLKTSTAENIQEAADMETSMDRKTMEELINNQTKKANKSLLKEINDLKNNIKQLNSTKGGPTGASSTNKSQQNNKTVRIVKKKFVSTKGTKKQQQGQKAGVVAKGTAKNKKTTANHPKTKQKSSAPLKGKKKSSSPVRKTSNNK